jgi:hypothetical protein
MKRKKLRKSKWIFCHRATLAEKIPLTLYQNGVFEQKEKLTWGTETCEVYEKIFKVGQNLVRLSL